MKKRGAKTVKTESINSRNGQDSSGETVMKASVSTSFRCLLCSTEQSNSYASVNSSSAHPPPGNSGAFFRTFHPGGWGISLPSNYPGAFDHLTSFTLQHCRFF